MPNWGGVQTHAQNLVTVLLNNGHEVSLLTGEGRQQKNGRLNIVPVSLRSEEKEDAFWFEKANDAFIRLEKDRPIDIIFSEGGAARGLLTRKERILVPVVAFVHNMHFHYFYNNWQEVDGLRSFKSYIFRSIPLYLYGMVRKDVPFLSKCSKIVTGSFAIADDLRRYYRIPNDQIATIHNWLDNSQFVFSHLNRETIREELGICKNKIVFLLVGHIWRPKGFRFALAAFEQLLKNVTDAVLLVAGKGPDENFLRKYIRESRLLNFDCVKMLGLYSREKLPSLYSCADVFVLPSLLNEVLPYTLLEAMSCSLPIIATDISASREALGSDKCLVPRGDADSLSNMMMEYALNLSQRKAEAENYRKRVQKYFSIEAASFKLEQLIDSVTGENKFGR